MKKVNPYKYITDTSTGNSLSYQVRLPEIDHGTPYYNSHNLVSKSFAVTNYDSTDAALAAAQKWRDDYFKKKGLDFYTYQQKQKYPTRGAKKLSPNNTSGVIGVIHETQHKLCGIYYFYVGAWQEHKNGKATQKRKSFSCQLYGDDLAFELACIARWENLKPEQPLIVTNASVIPCEVPVPFILEKKR